MIDTNYKKVVHAAVWYNNKILLSQRLAAGLHKGFWSDPGGKKEENESLLKAIQRELLEETGIYLLQSNFEIVDSFIYPERKIKTFIFNVSLEHYHLSQIKNTEPEKHTHWQWFTKKEALKLNLIPSVRCYLENCC